MVNNTCVQCYRPRSLIILIYPSEFNHVKNSVDECVLVPGTTPLPDDDSCKDDEEYWYERTAYRLIPYSSCAGGKRLDRGAEHQCPGFKAHGPSFWLFVLLIPFGFTALVGYYYYRRSGLARGYVLFFFRLTRKPLVDMLPTRTIRLPGDGRSPYNSDSGILDTLASVPWFIVGVAGIAWEWVVSHIDRAGFRSRRGYRDLRVDEDAQILRFEDEE